MKRNNSQHSGLTQRTEYNATTSDVDTATSLKGTINKNPLASTSTLNGSKPTESELLTNRSYRADSLKKNYESNYLKLSNMIQETFLDIKHQTIKNDDHCMLMLKKSIPFDESDEMTLQTDPVILFQYIKAIYDKNLEIRKDAEKEISQQKETGVNDYESLLQKLEAEVRQHIRIEQQLKLYVESTQAKLDDFKDLGDPAQIEEMKKNLEDVKSENVLLNEKLKKRSNEIENYTKDLAHKSDIIRKLEQQLETLPILKNKIRELENAISLEALKSSEQSTLKSYNKSTRESDAFSKVAATNNSMTGDGKSRKNSQAFLGIPQESTKRKVSEKDRNKENYDFIKQELAKYTGDMNKLQLDSYRLHFDQNRSEKSSMTTKQEIYGGAKTSRRIEKSDDLKSSLTSRSKKPLRSESSSNLLKEKERSRVTDHDAYEERMSNLRSVNNLTSNGDMIENSRFGSDRLSGVTNYLEDSTKKMLEKRRSSKSRNERRESSEMINVSQSQSRNKIPKSSRPSSGYERQSYCPETHRIKRETEIYDLSKLKVHSPQKISSDRSQSVDSKAKLYRELKSRGEHAEKVLEEKRRRSTYNINQKQHQTTFNSTQRLSGVF